MRAAWSMLASLAVMLVLVVGLQAEDKKAKEETLKGTITCAKCDLKVADKCATVIKVEGKDGKSTVYYFDAAGNKANHQTICKSPKKGTVTGTVSEKDGKKVVTVKTVKFD